MLQGNPTAFVVGGIFAVFFLTFGVAHVLNGKTMTGIGLTVLGWAIYLPIVITLLLPSANQAGLVCLGVTHVLLALSMSARGADYV